MQYKQIILTVAIFLAFTASTIIAEEQHFTPACNECLTKHYRSLKSCKNAKFPVKTIDDLGESERACFCEMIDSPSLLYSCPDQCSSTTVDLMKSSIEQLQLPENRPNFCKAASVQGKSTGSRLAISGKAGMVLVLIATIAAFASL